MIVVAWLALADAHPLGAEVYGHATVITLSADSVRVDYQIEIPAAALLQEMRAAPDDARPFGARKLVALRDGLVLTVDGVAVPTVDVPVPQRGPSGVFISYDLALTAALLPGAHTVRLDDGNAPTAPGVSQVTIKVAPGVSVTDTDVRDGVWRPDGRASRLDVVVGGSAWDALLPPVPPERTLDEAMAPSWAEAALGQAPTPLGVALAAALAALAGASAPATGWRDRWGPLLLGLAGALPLPWAGWPVLGAIGATNALTVAWRPWAMGLVVGALAGSVGWRAAAVVVAASAVGRAACHLGFPPAARVAMAVAGPVWLAIRWFGAI